MAIGVEILDLPLKAITDTTDRLEIQEESGGLGSSKQISVDSLIATINANLDGVQTIVAGTNVVVDNTDPHNPIVNVPSLGIEQIIAGDNVSVTNPTGPNTTIDVTGVLNTVVGGDSITVDATDAENPIVNLDDNIKPGGSNLITLGDTKTGGAVQIAANGSAVCTIGNNSTSDVRIALGSTGFVDLGNSKTSGQIRIGQNATTQILIRNLAWPMSDGAAGEVLTTDGAGALSFQPAGGQVNSIVAGEDIDVDDTDPANPIVSLQTTIFENAGFATIGGNGTQLNIGIQAFGVTIGSDAGSVVIGTDSPVTIGSGAGVVNVAGGKTTGAVNIGNGATVDISIRDLLWPTADGNPGDVLTTDGSGVLSFQPGGGLVDSVNGHTGVVVLDYGDFDGAEPITLQNLVSIVSEDSMGNARQIALVIPSGDLLLGNIQGVTTIASASVPLATYGGSTYEFVTTQGGQTIGGSLTTTGPVFINAEVNPSLVQTRAGASAVEHSLRNSAGGIDLTLSTTAGFSLQQTPPGGGFEKNWIQGFRDGNLRIFHDGIGVFRTLANGIAIDGTTLEVNTVKYAWPGSDGLNDQVLTTNGSGVLSWTDKGGGITNPLPNNVFLQSEGPMGAPGPYDLIGMDAAGTIYVGNEFGFVATQSIQITSTSQPGDNLVLNAGGDISQLYSGGGVKHRLNDADGSFTLWQTSNTGSNQKRWMQAVRDGSVTIYHDNVARLATVNGGVSVLGPTLGINGVAYTWPAADGSNGQVLTTSGAGTLTWQTPGGGGGGVTSVVGSLNVTVDDTDPANPIVSVGEDSNVTVWGNNGLVANTSATGVGTDYNLIRGVASGGVVIGQPAYATRIQGEPVMLDFGGFTKLATTNTGINILGTTIEVNSVSYAWPGADGSNGQVLTTDGSGSLSWTTVGGGGGGLYVPIGVTYLTKTSLQSISSGNLFTSVTWSSAIKDDLSAWTSGSAVTVPVGVTRARVTAGIRWAGSDVGVRAATIYFEPDGAATDAIAKTCIPGTTDIDDVCNLTSPIIDVAPGDEFTLRATQTSGSSLNISANNSANILTYIFIEWFA